MPGSILVCMRYAERGDAVRMLIAVSRKHHLLDDGEVGRAIFPVQHQSRGKTLSIAADQAIAFEISLELGLALQPQDSVPSVQVELQ